MNLPKEIFHQTFQYLDKEELKECLTVCKAWSLPAFQNYYKELTINENNVTTLISILGQDQYFKHCEWVKTLNLCQENSNRILKNDRKKGLSADLTKKFLIYLPNLKKLSINTEKPNMDYVEFLLDLNTDKYLTKIETIQIKTGPFDADPYNLYYDVYYKFRASLIHLSIYHESKSAFASKYNGIINYLSQFKNLTSLNYASETNQAVSVYQLQVACPNLKALTFCSNKQIESSIFTTTSKLHSLSLSVPTLPSDYVDTLINHLPNTLNSLRLEFNDVDLYDWIHIISKEKALKLAEKMSNLSQAELRFEPTKKYNNEFEFDYSNMTLFFLVLNSFKGDKKVICTAEFSDYRSTTNIFRYSNGILYLYYGLRHQDFYGLNQGTMSDIGIAVPDTSVSILGPEIFNQTKFLIFSTNEQLANKVMKYLLVNCPHFNNIEYHGLNEPRHRFQLSTEPPDFLGPERRLDPIATSKEIIEFIRIKNFMPSSDVLNMLASCLPSLRYFSLGTECFSGLEDEPSQYVLVNLSKFTNLELFYFNMALILTKSNTKPSIIKFKYTDGDGDEFLYEYTEEKNMELKPISPKSLLSTNEESSTITLTFICKNSTKIILQKSKCRRVVVEVNHGIPQEARYYDYLIDSRFIKL